MLPEALLKDYADKFYGFGSWSSKIWFVGIEEVGGWEESDVQKRLGAWHRGGRLDLENAPTFYPASGYNRWHGKLSVQYPGAIDHVIPATSSRRLLRAARGRPNSQSRQVGPGWNRRPACTVRPLAGRNGGDTESSSPVFVAMTAQRE